MNDFPAFQYCPPTHEAIITFEGQEPRRILISASNNFQAFQSALRELFGDDLDAELPAFIIKCTRIE